MAKTGAEAEIEKMKILEQRIKAPSIWGRVPCGLRFEDLQDRRYEDAVSFLKKHYLPEEITYRSVKIADDQEGRDEFVHNVRIWMKDKMSIAVVKEDTDKLVGVLIMRIQEKRLNNRPDIVVVDRETSRALLIDVTIPYDENHVKAEKEKLSKYVDLAYEVTTMWHDAYSRTFSRVKLTNNPLYSTVMTFYNAIENPVNIYEKLGVRKYFKIYILALKNRYRHRGIGKELLKAAIALSASANVPAIAGIFTTARSQCIAEELGFEKFHEIYYIRYLIDEQIVFSDTGLGNYGAALMGYRIPNVEESEELKAHVSSRFVIQQLDGDAADADD